MNDQISPLKQQFLDTKAQYPNCILLFRVGDFYETFDEDAEITSRVLNIVLTKKSTGKGSTMPMAGIPFHALDDYLYRLIKAGYKVAICEQMTKPGEQKGLVKREIVRIVTPGTVLEPTLLERNINNYLASIFIDNDKAGFGYMDITTGEFCVTELSFDKLANEISRISPSEILIPQGQDKTNLSNVTECNPNDFRYDRCERLLKNTFGVSTLDGFGLNGHPNAICAAGAIIKYVSEMQKSTFGEIHGLNYYSSSSFMAIDEETKRNLELFESSSHETNKGNLLSVLNKTCTPMGARLLRRWIGQPSLKKEVILERQNTVEVFYKDVFLSSKIKEILKDIPDLERLTSRINSGIILPKELIALKNGLSQIPKIRSVMEPFEQLSYLLPHSLNDVSFMIDSALIDPSEGMVGDGNIIKKGYSKEFDEVKDLVNNSKSYLINLEASEKEKTGIAKLRVGYNSVFGYYLEVPNGSKNLVPDTYIRKQTLVNVERFYTPELKEFETQILHATENIKEIEQNLYRQLVEQIKPYMTSLSVIAEKIAEIDVLRSFGEVALDCHYVKPVITDKNKLSIVKGRHPIVETILPSGRFVPNDTEMSHDETQIMLITGPNMAGKSTYMKQVALIVVMAQIGSFVPADSVELSIFDRIFTRIGAHEDLSSGKSTFMVEMVETSIILNNATPDSLILLDEIGRGTSTYDGLSIAEAVVEYLHNAPKKNALTLFATHYHEMVKMASYLPKIKNYNIAVSEDGGEIVFLHRIIDGGTDKSYGIHVAKLAGIPKAVTNRADAILTELEKNEISKNKPKHDALQLPLMLNNSPVLEEISDLELDQITPIEALNKLYEFKERSKNELGK